MTIETPPQRESLTQSSESNQPEPLPAPTGRVPRDAWLVIPLVLILLVAAYFRLSGLNWDGDHHLHPDERFLTDTTSLLEFTFDPILYLKTSESPLNPYNVGKGLYVYGNFPMTATRLVGDWVTAACATRVDGCRYVYNSYNGIHIIGRVLSAMLDLVSVLFIFLIGRRLYDWRVGLLGALLLAIAVMPIQQSHFYTMDNWAAGLTTMSVYFAVRASEAGNRKRWWVLFGLALGLTVSSRINMAPLAVMAPAAAAVWLSRQVDWEQLRTARGAIVVQRAVVGVLLAAGVSVVTVRLAQPYAFADSTIVRETILAETGQEPGFVSTAIRSVVGLNPQWLGNMAEIQRLQAPEASFPPALQWTDRTAILFPLTNMILYGMGITAGIAAWLAFAWALWRIVRARPDWQAHALPVAWVGMYFLFIGTRWVKSVRYFLPIYPFLLMLAAWGLVMLWERAGNRPVQRAAAAVTVAIVILPSLLWANSFLTIYTEPVTRIAASEWMLENVASGATIHYTANGESQVMPLPFRGAVFEPGGVVTPIRFTLPGESIITGVTFNYLSDPDGGSDSETVIVALSPADLVPATQEQSPGETTVTLALDDRRVPVFVDLPDQAAAADQPFFLTLRAGSGGAIRAGTSVIANEHWDDPLPVRLDGKDPYGQYVTGISVGQLPVTIPDDDQKRADIYGWLEEADYIVLSSQRALWSVPRLPLTYPMMIAYYEGLFNGDLGFDLVAEFHADLHVGPLFISDTGGEIAWGAPPEIGWPPPGDLAAEEAFSVYDHPPVWIFAKRPDFDIRSAHTLLGAVDLSQQVTMNPGQATQARNGLLLPEHVLATQQANGTFRELFAVDGLLSQNPWAAAAVWWAAVVLLGWLSFPFTFAVLRGLPTRGYILARILGLLIISYFGWLMASLNLLPNTRGTLLWGVLLLATLSGIAAWRQSHDLNTYFRRRRGYILMVEGLALVLFLIAVAIRLGNPEVWDVIWGGEKPMDLSYFTAVLKSTTFPPYDPWFAGGYINYYYYGFVYVGALTKLLGIVPTMAYNLILPMLYSFTGMAAFSIAYNLVDRYTETSTGETEMSGSDMAVRPAGLRSLLRSRAMMGGLMALALCVLLGNLGQAGVAARAAYETGIPDSNQAYSLLARTGYTLKGAFDMTLGGEPARIRPSDWFWNASRALNYNPGEAQPITEFPFFTFLYGDLHAHMIAMPLMLLALAWAASLVMGPLTGRSPYGKYESLTMWMVGGIAIGVLRATNTWDWPTYLVIGALAAGYHAIRGRRFSLQSIGMAGAQAALIVILGTLTFLPFADNYGQAYASVSRWPGSYSQLGSYLSIYGLFLFIIVSYLLMETRAWTRTWTREGMVRLEPFGPIIVLMMFGFVGILALMTLIGYLIAPVVLTLVVLSGLLGLQREIAAPRRIALVLTSAALALTLVVELVVLDGDIGRMNMVFKFYVQVWLILSVVGGAAFAWVWPRVNQRSRLFRTTWQVALGLLVGVAAIYPITATKAKWDSRMNPDGPTTLDGMAFMAVTSYQDSNATIELKYDYEAIKWLQRNVDGSPVIAEAHSGNPYRSIGNRIAMYTGLPAIVGWDWHQRQQRAVLPATVVGRRINDVNALYNTTDIEQANRILSDYNVGYIYAGQLETVYYSPDGLAKFDQMTAMGYLERVYEADRVKIYRVVN